MGLPVNGEGLDRFQQSADRRLASNLCTDSTTGVQSAKREREAKGFVQAEGNWFKALVNTCPQAASTNVTGGTK
jgi:hypothetical protein